MSSHEFRVHIAKFSCLLATMLLAMVLYYGVESVMVSRPIIVAKEKVFKICRGYEIVKPGEAVCYQIHYFKRLDIPGELTKQLVIQTPEGKKVYLPLEYLSGHLPVGEVNTRAYAKIPDWAPEGKARIKITSAHFTGRVRQFCTVYTEPFEVRK